MKTKRNLALAILGVAVGAVVILTQSAWTDRNHEPFKLEGTWIARLQATPPQSWIYSFSPSDPSGREATFQGMNIVGDPTFGGVFPEAQQSMAFAGKAVVTGRDEASYTVANYGIKKVGAATEVVYIGLDSGTIRRISPGKTQVDHYLAIFLAAQDADGDGLPDKGQVPIACVPFVSIDTSLPLMAPCKP